MRQIKFRAWDGRRMYYPTDTDHPFVDAITGTPYKKLYYLPMSYLLGDSNGLTWLQFTGLLDKNGKEIYEGDILRYNDEAYRVDDIVPLHRHTHVTNIGYFDVSDKYHRRDHPAGQYDNGDDWMSWPEMYEVIGNIYENIELLTK